MISFVSRLLPCLLAAAATQAHSQDRDGRYDRDGGRDRGEDLQLVCYGGGQKTSAEVHSGFEWDARQHKYVPKQSVETGKADFNATLTVSIHDDRGQVQLPKTLIPPLHRDNSDGWFPIDDLIVGHNEIRGKFRLNGLNQPRLSIDRRTGAITIDGLIQFNGRCDADAGHRRF